ncbi:hypothetical protein AYJ57_21295 (plasmid) [Salipiger sp. CCB-MM3]|uniref:hypothetical protein n=1 Tax=Salipiger sp. CCB-MM3 TaxID=1792508 RepID=UPI00080A9D19|nr:hypothetical protein [Salipiger sp. CCB-MM3]ANT63013.1 hypothetical protein AYJ57_21295 [Salipiger sp. CCB-MM3]
MAFFSSTKINRNGATYATMLMADEVGEGPKHYAGAWHSESFDAEKIELQSLQALHAKVGGTLKAFTSKEVLEASERDEKFKNLAPVGAQFSKKLTLMVFDL